MRNQSKKLTAIIIACIAVVVVIALLVTHMNPGGTKKEAGQKAAETDVSAESEPVTDAVSEGAEKTAEDSAVSEMNRSVSETGSEVSETVQEPESTEETRPDDNNLPVIPPEEGGTEIIRDDEPQEPQTTPTPAPQEPQPAENPEPPADDGRDAYETPIIIDPD